MLFSAIAGVVAAHAARSTSPRKWEREHTAIAARASGNNSHARIR
jgi:hypothetical protein